MTSLGLAVPIRGRGSFVFLITFWQAFYHLWSGHPSDSVLGTVGVQVGTVTDSLVSNRTPKWNQSPASSCPLESMELWESPVITSWAGCWSTTVYAPSTFFKLAGAPTVISPGSGQDKDGGWVYLSPLFVASFFFHAHQLHQHPPLPVKSSQHSVLVSLGCQNKAPQTRGLKQQPFIFSQC